MNKYADTTGVRPSINKEEEVVLLLDSEAQWHAMYSAEESSAKAQYVEIYRQVKNQLDVERVFLDPKLSLDKLSAIIGTNTTYLSNTINKLFGCHFRRLINSYRVRYACELLKSGKCDVQEVYKHCGFASQSVFYVTFAREVGMSPLHFVNHKGQAPLRSKRRR